MPPSLPPEGAQGKEGGTGECDAKSDARSDAQLGSGCNTRNRADSVSQETVKIGLFVLFLDSTFGGLRLQEA